MGDDNFLKLFRLSQLSIEYLIYSQNYLECLTRTLNLQYKNAYEATESIKTKLAGQRETIENLKKENKMK